MFSLLAFTVWFVIGAGLTHGAGAPSGAVFGVAVAAGLVVAAMPSGRWRRMEVH